VDVPRILLPASAIFFIGFVGAQYLVIPLVWLALFYNVLAVVFLNVEGVLVSMPAVSSFRA
jgi:hypothetical protein